MFLQLDQGQFFALNRPVKILLIKLDHLGDFLLALPAINALKDKLGPCELDLVIGSWNLSLAKKVDSINNIFTFDFFKQQSKLAPQLQEKALNDLLSQLPEYDIAIDLRRFEDTRFLLSRVNAQYKIGYQSFNAKIDATLNCILPATPNQPNVLTPSNQIHTSIQMLRLVEAIPFRVVNNPPLIAAPKKEQAIGIFPFAGQPTKEWPLERFKDLIAKMNKAYPNFVIHIYITKDRLNDFEEYNNKTNIFCHAEFNIDQVVDHARQNQVIIANDSFGAHLAYHVGASLVCIYAGVGPMQEFSACFGSYSLLKEEVECSPCHIPNKKACLYDLKCLNNITVDQVLNAVQYHLEHKTYQQKRNLYYFL